MTKNNRNLPTFMIQEGYGTTYEYVMKKKSIVIGRDPECDIVIDKGEASRKHAKVICKDDNFFIEDLKSVNGIFLNSVPTSGKQQIKHQDIIDSPSFQLTASETKKILNRKVGVDSAAIAKLKFQYSR